MLTGHIAHDGIVQWPHRPQHFKALPSVVRESSVLGHGDIELLRNWQIFSSVAANGMWIYHGCLIIVMWTKAGLWRYKSSTDSTKVSRVTTLILGSSADRTQTIKNKSSCDGNYQPQAPKNVDLRCITWFLASLIGSFSVGLSNSCSYCHSKCRRGNRETLKTNLNWRGSRIVKSGRKLDYPYRSQHWNWSKKDEKSLVYLIR